MAAVRFRQRRVRRWWYLGMTLVAVAAALVFVLSASASHGVVSLAGSNFEIDTNANLKVDDPAPSIDWASVSETRKADQPSGATDDSFGQGTKEDTAVPTVVNGSIPPQKSDLLTFGVYLETTASGARFLNLFWHRVQEPNGTTNMDFEFNKSSTLSANGVTPVRTAGDLLIQYDLASGGTHPELFLSRWVTSGAASQCQASNSVPCWGTRSNLTAAGDATGSINTTAIPSSESDGLGDVSARTFGEAQLDFDALSGGGCVPFGSAYLKSRSSDSFTAAVKDFIAPATLNLSTCGTITIIKHTNPGGLDQDFDFTSTITGGSELSCTSDSTPASFTLNDAGTDTETCTNVPIGNYTVLEGADPTGFAFDDVTCVATGSGTGAQDATVPKQANISINAGDDSVTCTYVNTQQLGAIKISKTSSKTGNGLAGATFSITGPGGYSNSVQSGADGTVCVDGLVFGDYTVTETGAPTGFVIDDTSGHTVTVDNNTSCSADPYDGETTSFTDTPTADIQVNFRDGGSGETSGTITCDNTTGTGSDTPATGWDTSRTVTGVHAPTEFHCTIVIDP
jgi:Prealbumin-like fold domain